MKFFMNRETFLKYAAMSPVVAFTGKIFERNKSVPARDDGRTEAKLCVEDRVIPIFATDEELEWLNKYFADL